MKRDSIAIPTAMMITIAQCSKSGNSRSDASFCNSALFMFTDNGALKLPSFYLLYDIAQAI